MRILTAFLCCFGAMCAMAQPTGVKYFQQEVNYKIDVALDDQAHLLRGRIEMTYKNNSSNALTEIYLHLWPNAYVDRHTHFAQQKIDGGNAKFHFGSTEDRGHIDSLSFMVDGMSATTTQYKDYKDIVVLTLPKPLAAGGSIKIASPMRVDIPKTWSRMGHDEQSYQISQWYPKPAVYDALGWHPIPYLDQGEFYSEFGSFDVTLTLPKNYVVGATGSLQTESEVKWLSEKVTESNRLLADESRTKDKSYPASASETKTIRYTADKVHDFAWFADKRYFVQRGQVTLKSGRKVDTWAMFSDDESDLWADSAVFYVGRGVTFYSDVVGEYPYPQATAVQGALLAGGGMEYPMITVIAGANSRKSLDNVIIHEVGHNWFYGILASNERQFAWMDEGFNTYVEGRYMRTYYPKSENQFSGILKKLTGNYEIDENQLMYRLLAERGFDQAPSTDGEDMNTLNYGLMSYFKTGFVLRWLELYHGTEPFDRAMHQYFDTWKFKHPQPADVKASFEKSLSDDLSWLFEDQMRRSGSVNYKITDVRNDGNTYYVSLKSTGNAPAPIPVCLVRDGKTISTTWVDARRGETGISIPNMSEADEIVLDNDRITLDLFDADNRYRLKGIFPKCEPLSLRFITGVDRPDRSTAYIAPFVIANQFDGFGLGLALYNGVMPQRRFDWLIAPAYGFRSKEIVGKVQFDRHFITRKSKLLREVTLSGEAQRFSGENIGDNSQFFYNRISPALTFHFRHAATSNTYSDVTLRHRIVGINQDLMDQIPTIRYTRNANHKLKPYTAFAELELFKSGNTALGWGSPRLTAMYDQKWRFTKNQAVCVKLYGSVFTNPLENYRPMYLGEISFSDYRLDQYYFARNSFENSFWARQVAPHAGAGMKIPVIAINHAAFTASGELTLHRLIPIRPFFDFGYGSSKLDASNFYREAYWNGGLLLDLGIGAVYFPLVYSGNLRDNLPTQYSQRITYSIDLRKIKKPNLPKLVNTMMSL